MNAPLPAEVLLAAFSKERAVDTTCHIGQWPFRLGAAATVADARAYAQRHGLSSLWVSHLAALFGFDTRTGNAACLQACRGDDLFTVFAVLNPTEPTWKSELEWALNDGAAGIRIAPGLHGFSLSSAIPLAEECRSHDVPLQVLIRVDDARVRSPFVPIDDPRPDEIAEFLRAAGQTRILLSGVRRDEWDETMRHLADTTLSEVTVDLWHVNGPLNVADRLAEEPARWVFGSGFPLQTPEATMLQITASILKPDARTAITRANAQRLLHA